MPEEMQNPQEKLELKIGYSFKDKKLLKNALMHSSCSNENRGRDEFVESNERLEFLGDSVLSIIVSDYIYKNYRDFDEGDLTKIRAAVVCENSLAVFAGDILLGSYMYLGHGEIVTHGRNRKSIISDAFEALLAAIYLDGGIECARDFLLPRVIDEIKKTVKKGNEDYKSKLQKIVQQTPEELLEYILTDEQGPPHDRIFTIEVCLNSNVLGTGTGHSKREAEQMAAMQALEFFGDENENS
ncbi:MAG: ribonuclease III [Clostridia bacterium]